jgi:hypothetical protein
MNRTLTARTRVGTRGQLCSSVSFLATPFHFDSEEHRGTLPAGVAETPTTHGEVAARALTLCPAVHMEAKWASPDSRSGTHGSFTKVAGHRCTRLSRPVTLTVAGWSKSEEDPR